MYARNFLLLLAVSLISTTPAFSDRIYTGHTSLDVVGALDDNPQLSASRSRELEGNSVEFVYGLYHSIMMNSTSPHSDLRLSYAFGLEKSDTGLRLGATKSHGLEGSFKASLSQKLRMEFSESYVSSSDFGTFNFMRGTTLTPGDALFRYSTVTLRRNGYFNGVNAGFSYALNPISSLSWTVSHIVRNYENSFPENRLSKLQGLDANLRFNRKINKRTSWSLGYSMYQYWFKNFADSRTLAADFALFHQISPGISVELIAGPSKTSTAGPGTNYVGYNSSVNLAKSIKKDKLTVAFYRRSGTSMGVGSISDSQGVAFYYSRFLGRKAALEGAASLYDARDRVDNPLKFKGAFTSVSLNYLLKANWALTWGASYQQQKGTDILDLGRTRVFVSLRFLLPEFLRVAK